MISHTKSDSAPKQRPKGDAPGEANNTRMQSCKNPDPQFGTRVLQIQCGFDCGWELELSRAQDSKTHAAEANNKEDCKPSE